MPMLDILLNLWCNDGVNSKNMILNSMEQVMKVMFLIINFKETVAKLWD